MMLDTIKNTYEDHVLPHLIDRTCSLAQITEQRQKVVPLATGMVLEVGVGTGLNAAHYDKTKVTQVIGVDPHLHPKAVQRFAKAGVKLVSKPLSAETLPLDDDSIDSIVMTFTLCTIPHPALALSEMKRVLKPTGKLYYAEHGLAPNPTAWFQHKLNPVWKPFSGGCNLNRNTEALLNEAGFALDGNKGFVHQPSIAGYHYWGVASIHNEP